MKLLFRKQKRTIVWYTNKKVLWSLNSKCFFPAFLFFDDPFFLKSLEQRDTDSLFATIPLCYSLFGVGCTKGVECLCTQFVKCNTGVILSQSTSTWQALCARYLLPVGWFCWPHSTRRMYHRTVPMFDTSLQWAGVCLRESWFFWTRLWWLPSLLPGFQLWGTLSASH